MGKPSDNAIRPTRWGDPRGGFTLVELLIVIVLLGIGAGVVVSLFEPSVHGQLTSAAEVLAADIAYTRNLAVSNDSQYRLQFETDNGCYRLTHSGTNAALDTLPATPFDDADGTATEQVFKLSDLPNVGAPVQMWAVWQVTDTTKTAVTDVRFTPLGGTQRAEPTRIWLSSLEGERRVAIPITIDPVTGLAEVGEIQAAPAKTPPVDLTPGPVAGAEVLTP